MGVPFGVRFFLVLTEKHFFLALIREICRPVIFSCFTEGGVFGAGQNKEREARAVWEFPVSQCRPLSLQFPSLEVGGGGFIRIFFYAI